MDERDNDDLARRLAGRLRPVRVPGADEAWHRLAPRLGDAPPPQTLVPRRVLTIVALYVATLALVFFLIVLVPGRPGSGVAAPTAPVSAPATARSATPLARPLVREVGAGVVSVQPALPFTLWQPGYNTLSAHLVSYAYRPDGGGASAPATTSARVDTRGDGKKDDPAVVAAAESEGRALLGDDTGAALVLVYAADGLTVGAGQTRPTPGPTRLFAVAQRPADGRALPPGEAAWFSGIPATFAREGDRVVLSWLAGDTFLTLTTNRTPEQAVVFAESLRPTALVPPDVFVPAPTPTLTLPTPLPAGSLVGSTVVPCPAAPASTGRRLLCPSDPAAPAGTPTFTEADVRRQYTPHIGDTSPFIAVVPPQLATVEFLTAGAVGVRLGRGMKQPDAQPLCVITLAGDFILPPSDQGYPPVAYRTVILILDARTGDWFATTGTTR